MHADAEPSPSPAVEALTGLCEALDSLIDAVESGALDHLDTDGLVGFLRDFERFRNRLPVVDHTLIGELDRREVAGHLTYHTTKSMLTHVLRLSPQEAGRRVRAADAVGRRATMLGGDLEPTRPGLADLQRAGLVSTEQVAIVSDCLTDIDRPGMDVQEVQAAEETLTNYALQFGPLELRRIASHLAEVIHPDGSVPQEELNAERRHVFLRVNGDGSYSLTGRLTGPVGSALSAVLQPLARPRTDSSEEGSSISTVPDRRSYGMRMHDALEDVCARLLREGDLPMSGGTPATLIVTVSHDDLAQRVGYGETTNGALIPTRQLLQLATEADIIPAVLNASGSVLDLGRTRRVASPTQALALVARDGGCSFPGCQHPPEWCDRHHITPWIDGGPTSVSNLTLLCRYHHTHFVAHGWACRLDADGIPEWIPPRWVDPEQRALRTTGSPGDAFSAGMRSLTTRRRARRGRASPRSWLPKTLNQPAGGVSLRMGEPPDR